MCKVAKSQNEHLSLSTSNGKDFTSYPPPFSCYQFLELCIVITGGRARSDSEQRSESREQDIASQV